MPIIPIERLAQAIVSIRGQKVMLDADLAALYGVEVRSLLQAVWRNAERFPQDFMFQLTDDEFARLRSQLVIAKQRGGRRYPPYAFTEQGVALLSSVLNSQRAIQVNIEIMRAFVGLRAAMVEHTDLARRLDELEQKYDSQFEAVFDAIREFMALPEAKHRRIGFHTGAPDRAG